jgi:hypothetical protein
MEILQSDDISNPANLGGTGDSFGINEDIQERGYTPGQFLVGGIEGMVDDPESGDIVYTVIGFVMASGIQYDSICQTLHFVHDDGVHQIGHPLFLVFGCMHCLLPSTLRFDWLAGIGLFLGISN